jgi:hypothetical protein
MQFGPWEVADSQRLVDLNCNPGLPKAQTAPERRLAAPQVTRSDFSLCEENRKDGEIPSEPLQSHRFRLAQGERAAKNCLNVLGNEDLIA